MKSTNQELPKLSTGAGICGAGDAVTGPLCLAVAAALWLAAQ